MNRTRGNELLHALAVLLVIVISTSSIVAVTFYAFIFGKPDGTMPTPVIAFLLPMVGIYLLFTFVGAAVGAWLWRAAPVWLSLVAAFPYLMLAPENGSIWLGVALFTFGVQYAAIHLRRVRSESNTA